MQVQILSRPHPFVDSIKDRLAINARVSSSKELRFVGMKEKRLVETLRRKSRWLSTIGANIGGAGAAAAAAQ